MFKGITKRWMLNTLSVILTIIISLVVCLIFIVTYLFQSSVEQSLASTCSELSLVFSGYTSDSSTNFTSSARDYVENFEKKEQMEVMVDSVKLAINDIKLSNNKIELPQRA